MDATKRPWQIRTRHNQTPQIWDGEIGICRLDDRRETAANARLIVTAVNHFDEIVEVLEQLLPVAENWACNCEINGEGPNNPATVKVREARALLAKVREG